MYVKESDFFVGRTISVPVSGVNLGALQSIDAGTTIKLTPQTIEAERVKFKIEASRSFFDSGDQIPGFAQQINVFKESASATAQLNYGETLILSGLSENVSDSDHNVVPELWQAPVVGGLFGRHDVSTEKTSVLILVTPLKPVETELPRHITREGEVAQVVRLWDTLIEPSSNVAAIVNHVSIYGDPQFIGFDRSRREDISLLGPSDKQILRELSADTAGAPPPKY